MKSWPDKSESCFVGETQDSGESSQFCLLKIVAVKWDICFPFKTNKEVIGGKFVPVSVREWGLLRPKINIFQITVFGMTPDTMRPSRGAYFFWQKTKLQPIVTCINKFDLRVLIMEQIITKDVSPINLFVICMLAKPAGAKVAVLLLEYSVLWTAIVNSFALFYFNWKKQRKITMFCW